jgi:hypothetical protein
MRVTKLAIAGADQAGVDFVKRKSPKSASHTTRLAVAQWDIARSSSPMRDIVIGVAFLAMLLSPAIVASFSKGKTDDEA